MTNWSKKLCTPVSYISASISFHSTMSSTLMLTNTKEWNYMTSCTSARGKRLLFHTKAHHMVGTGSFTYLLFCLCTALFSVSQCVSPYLGSLHEWSIFGSHITFTSRAYARAFHYLFRFEVLHTLTTGLWSLFHIHYHFN